MKKILALILTFSFSALALSSCVSDKEPDDDTSSSSVTSSQEASSSNSEELFNFVPLDQVLNFKNPSDNDMIADIETSIGNIKIVLYKDVAPKAVENFVTHSESGYYNGVSFHRVIKDFMIQTGDPKGDGTGGESIWGKGFENEINPKALHFRGALSMANTGQPNSNGSQFFIVQANKIDSSLVSQMKTAGYTDEIIEKYQQVGGTPWLDTQHTVFGHVISGIEVVDSIAASEVSNDKPVNPVTITSIKIAK